MEDELWEKEGDIEAEEMRTKFHTAIETQAANKRSKPLTLMCNHYQSCVPL